MALLEVKARGRLNAEPPPQHDVSLVVVPDMAAAKKHMACLPGLGNNKWLMNGLAQEFTRVRPDYEAKAADVSNAGPVGSEERIRKEKDQIKSEADVRQQPVTVTGFSWGSLDALRIAAELPKEVDEVVLLFSPHRLRKILSGNVMIPGHAYIINASGLLDPVTLVGGKYKHAKENVRVLSTHLGPVNPLEVKQVVKKVAPRLRGQAKPNLSIAS